MRALDFARLFRGVRQRGEQWSTACPAHSDTKFSLTFRDGEDGLLICCQAGCSPESICAALKKSPEELFPPKKHENKEQSLSWNIQDLRGRTIAVHKWIIHPNRDKELFWEMPNGKRGFRGIKLEELPLYRTQHIAGFDTLQPIFLCEGERSADTLASIGEQALGTVTGADATPLRSVFECLRGCFVVVVPHNSGQGRDHMRRCMSFLRNIASAVSVLELPGVPEGGSAEDWIEQQKQKGLTNAEQVRAAIRQLPRKQSIEKVVAVAKDIPRKPPESSWRPALLEKLQKEGGKPLSTIDNAISILARDPRWEGVLGFNELGHQVVFLRPPPWDEDAAPLWPVVSGTSWQEADAVRLVAWLSRYWGMRLSSDDVRDAAALVAQKKSFHPVKDQLKAFRWDGQPRLDTWLCRYLGAADTPYVRKAGAKWMLSAVARVEKPGTRVDRFLVLEGGKGAEKSNALEILAGASLFSGILSNDIKGQDAAIALRCKWIVEIAEFNKSERQTELGAFVSKSTDRYIGPFGKSARDYPRQCVFCGTAEQLDSLRTKTDKGFWRVRAGSIDVEALGKDREQLWAEARVRFLAGEHWWLEENEKTQPQRKERDQVDVWLEPIRQWLLMRNRTYATIADVLQEALRLPEERWDQGSQNRVARLLIQMGWERKRVSAPLGRLWRYEAPKSGGKAVPVSKDWDSFRAAL